MIAARLATPAGACPVAVAPLAENKLSEPGLIADRARDGILVAIGISGLQTGALFGAKGTDILSGGARATTPTVDPNRTGTKFNQVRLRARSFEIGPDKFAFTDTIRGFIGGR